jgi:hypothetical protein
MNLVAIRQEILNHGFDPTLFPATRLNQYINDAQNLIARRVDYSREEASYVFTTSVGTSNYPFDVPGGGGPQDVSVVRSLVNTDLNHDLQAVSLRMIDRSSTTQGEPLYYAIDGGYLHLYPTPDGVYDLKLRYWKMPAALVQDTDVPSLPTDWHHLLWVYCCWICYEAEDDANMGQYWKQRFEGEISEFIGDQKFPSTDMPTQAQSMWEQDASLSANGWSLYAGW